MTDALNQMIYHKHEETLPCPADAGHPALVLFSPHLHRTMLARFRCLKHNSRMSLHKCYSKCCLDVLKIPL